MKPHGVDLRQVVAPEFVSMVSLLTLGFQIEIAVFAGLLLQVVH